MKFVVDFQQRWLRCESWMYYFFRNVLFVSDYSCSLCNELWFQHWCKLLNDESDTFPFEHVPTRTNMYQTSTIKWKDNLKLQTKNYCDMLHKIWSIPKHLAFSFFITILLLATYAAQLIFCSTSWVDGTLSKRISTKLHILLSTIGCTWVIVIPDWENKLLFSKWKFYSLVSE